MVLMQDGAQHRISRKLILPVFLPQAIASYFDTIQAVVTETIDEDGNRFTETQVINQAIGFLFAGHDTTSSLMSWLLFELGNSPEWRQRLREGWVRSQSRLAICANFPI